ncbi:hypothetical protein C2845_PM06G08330 [Panicum miliaceum]|uniref:Legume lectin domain-containing protein n=1 Tax=Panicum miliaceum TaxID=4540 RepID=A0A3L6R6K9_PANMI|nr:hypothetical protein C2845_PM06G08330 [Panicum miliaceum]
MARAALPLALALLLLLQCAPEPAAAVRFDYATLTLGSLKLLGDAHLKNGTIRLSRDLPVPTSGSGRALYASAVPVRAGFSTQFAFTVATLNPSSVGGGLAFVVAADDSSLGDAGPYIGVATGTDAAAVEFDTLMDVQFGDVNGNHVGLDLGSMVSAAVADLDEAGVELTSGRTVNAWIDYRPDKAKGGILEVSVSYAAKRPMVPLLSAPVDLGESVKDAAFVGFSASTQGSTEVHAIEWWSFSTASPAPAPHSAPTPPPQSPVVQPPPSVNPVLPSPLLPGVTTPSPPSATVSAPTSSISAASAPSNAAAGNAGSPHPPAHAAVAGAATAGAFVAASFAGFALWALARRARARKRTALAVATKRDNLALHGEVRVLDAVDPRLGGEFDEGEVRRALLVGLACSSPEPALRPGMRAVVQMLSGEADPPFVPAARPSMSFSANHQLLLSLQDSVSDYNALGLTLSDSSSDSLSSSSLTSTLRRGGHDIGFSSTGGDAR